MTSTMRIRGYFLLALLIALLPACATTSKTAVATASNPPFPNSHFVTINDEEVHYRSWASATTPAKGQILLVHGFCGSTFTFRKTAEPLTQAGFEVVAIDIPPFGYSERTRGADQSPQGRAKVAWGLIDAIDGDSDDDWILMGHSMGAGTVGAMALSKPERTQAAIFVDGAMGLGSTSMVKARKSIVRVVNFPPFKGAFKCTATHVLFRRGMMKRFVRYAYQAKPDDEAIDGYRVPLLIPGTASGILDLFNKQTKPAPLEPSQIRAPSLIIWGEKDPLAARKMGEALHQSITGSTFIVMPGAGHCPMETHADAFNKLVLDFVNESVDKP